MIGMFQVWLLEAQYVWGGVQDRVVPDFSNFLLFWGGNNYYLSAQRDKGALGIELTPIPWIGIIDSSVL